MSIQASNIRPPIKWPGGKSEEFKYIEDLIPAFDRYFEPFFGGGAIFFKLAPKEAVINDTVGELMSLYSFIKGNKNSPKFKEELYEYVSNWEKIPIYISFFKDKFTELYKAHKTGMVDQAEVAEAVSSYVYKYEKKFNGLFSANFCIDPENLARQIISNLISKIKRTKQIELERGDMDAGDLELNIETAFRSGFYMYFRDVMNYQGTKYRLTEAKRVANFYFVREFCYGSMFRFNADDKFNIPYGGVAYNRKDFRKKVDGLFAPEMKKLFKNVAVKTGDFEDIFRSYSMSKKDFIFIDPPYDTEFSSYDNQTFTQDDHKRLARCLYRTKAKFIQIIKKTPFILELYANRPGIKIKEFEKKYVYNVRGRNDQNATHLIIYNF